MIPLLLGYKLGLVSKPVSWNIPWRPGPALSEQEKVQCRIYFSFSVCSLHLLLDLLTKCAYVFSDKIKHEVSTFVGHDSPKLSPAAGRLQHWSSPQLDWTEQNKISHNDRPMSSTVGFVTDVRPHVHVMFLNLITFPDVFPRMCSLKTVTPGHYIWCWPRGALVWMCPLYEFSTVQLIHIVERGSVLNCPTSKCFTKLPYHCKVSPWIQVGLHHAVIQGQLLVTC